MKPVTNAALTCVSALSQGAGFLTVSSIALLGATQTKGENNMGALIVVAALMMSAAVLGDAGTPSVQIDLNGVPPPLPENVAIYEPIAGDERSRGSDEDPDSCTTVQHRLIALAR
jgi:hypothetical protein